MRAKRAIAACLAASGFYVGVWASVLPASFYETFPGLHQSWISTDGPYNEHLIRDVGGLYLGLAVATAIAAFLSRPEGLALVGVAWSTFSVVHLLYHATHLEAMSPVDRVNSQAVLLATLIGAIILCAPFVRTRCRPKESRSGDAGR